MADPALVLDANEAFYRAFAEGDFATMEALWATDVPVVCLHPGWPPLADRAKIMQSWEGIFANPPAPAVRPIDIDVHIHGDTAFIVCFEVIGDQYLVATNIFIFEAGAWKMVHHQSAPVRYRPSEGQHPPSGTVH